ncbi:MAG: sulfide/dihydroorotate dehydrogenase-like FAD/NAD-binding protein [Candidatus Bathyarchaeota archaeon]|nr:sulfide/dihydroorotate dehydrogenase-like FAD/NAD-binding protein [Candidatus Bathyarchaeota archaeon]
MQKLQQQTIQTTEIATAKTHTITDKKQIAPQITQIDVIAPDIATKAKAGQFAILKVHENSERIPLTLVTWNNKNGTITLIFQEVGFSTKELGKLNIGDAILNIAGPLGKPSEIKGYGKVAVVCGGVGTAAAYPIAKALKETGNTVISVVGARNQELLVLEPEMQAVSNEFYITTDDGSKGHKGFVSDVLKTLIDKNYGFDAVYAIGPPIMMKVIADVTRPYKIKTIVSLNPIMVDGMGMCGACRVTVGGQTKFACVDGPEFDAHQVDFKELIQRLKSYVTEEKSALQTHRHEGGKCRCQNQ